MAMISTGSSITCCSQNPELTKPSILLHWIWPSRWLTELSVVGPRLQKISMQPGKRQAWPRRERFMKESWFRASCVGIRNPCWHSGEGPRYSSHELLWGKSTCARGLLALHAAKTLILQTNLLHISPSSHAHRVEALKSNATACSESNRQTSRHLSFILSPCNWHPKIALSSCDYNNKRQ